MQWQEAGSGVPAGRGEEGRDLAAPLRPDGGPMSIICKLGHGNIKRASIFKVSRMQRFVYLERMLVYL